MLKESKTRRKNVAMIWIVNKKAYDMILQSWIIVNYKMYFISNEVIRFIEETMKKKTMKKSWRVELTAGGKSLAYVKIQRGIFQGNALSPLLFIKANIYMAYLRNAQAAKNLQNQKKRFTT